QLDLFDGIVIHTAQGLRFIDPDRIQTITRSYVKCTISDDQAAQLPPPDGPPVYHVDALENSGDSVHDVLGRMLPAALEARPVSPALGHRLRSEGSVRAGG